MRILGILVIIVVVAVGAVIFYIDSLAKTAIERGSNYALGVPTSVDGVSIGFLSGRFGIRGLDVANPEGFEAENFLHLGAARMDLPLGNLREQTVEIPLVEITDIDVSIERSQGKTNYDVILSNLEKLSSGKAEPAEDTGPGKTFVIGKLLIRDVSANVQLSPLPGEVTKVKVEVPEINLQNVGGEGGGVGFAELSGIITTAVLASIAKNGVGLPGDLVKDLNSGLSSLGSFSIESVGKVGELGGKLVEGLATEGKEGDKATADKLIEGIGGLFGGSKD